VGCKCGRLRLGCAPDSPPRWPTRGCAARPGGAGRAPAGACPLPAGSKTWGHLPSLLAPPRRGTLAARPAALWTRGRPGRPPRPWSPWPAVARGGRARGGGGGAAGARGRGGVRDRAPTALAAAQRVGRARRAQADCGPGARGERARLRRRRPGGRRAQAARLNGAALAGCRHNARPPHSLFHPRAPKNSTSPISRAPAICTRVPARPPSPRLQAIESSHP
jgi:hypothetical protein